MKKLLIGVMVVVASVAHAELPSWLPGYDADAIERAQPHPTMKDAPGWLKNKNDKNLMLIGIPGLSSRIFNCPKK
jgi:hypothetical protein